MKAMSEIEKNPKLAPVERHAAKLFIKAWGQKTMQLKKEGIVSEAYIDFFASNYDDYKIYGPE